MAYDEELADRIREVSQGEPGLSEKRMFGGLAFLVDGNMAVAPSSKRDLMVRIDPARGEELLARDHVEPMEMGGKEMGGWLRVGTPALTTDDALAEWVEVGFDYARTLPPK
ncbi:TfoX/Sxy family transcriptional regulator of competence genes [Marmoricola sp. OAE513]|uniref:TfoX/Sxy family protein n=1 Tax=Marmoricola sp. OAE513 TaxID=2817894 RepID=UPI001D23CBFC